MTTLLLCDWTQTGGWMTGGGGGGGEGGRHVMTFSFHTPSSQHQHEGGRMDEEEEGQ